MTSEALDQSDRVVGSNHAGAFPSLTSELLSFLAALATSLSSSTHSSCSTVSTLPADRQLSSQTCDLKRARRATQNINHSPTPPTAVLIATSGPGPFVPVFLSRCFSALPFLLGLIQFHYISSSLRSSPPSITSRLDPSCLS